ncbi:uncharacterized protein LOC124924451 [Impatiens glandulifera]|uniref:uncharacterized protein LOC124924451 n=1 Tax=Impatiens glandulifera TaxID=253017 RepID=UPI001FB1470E|nr:uncharacterized protein LOC124924451 [Impatiens glandulifera]
MDSDIPFTSLAPPMFNGNNYHIWAARMEAHLEVNDLWKTVEEKYVVPKLQANPTLAQMKNHKEKKTGKSKARATMFAVVSSEIFIRIMTIKSEFKMKDSKTIKEYSNKLLTIVNKVRLLDTKFPNSRLVQKVLVTVPERFEAIISSLENTKDLSKVSLVEILSAFQAQEQRRLMMNKEFVEGAFPAKV